MSTFIRPKTADGVPIFAGMKLWDANGQEFMVAFVSHEPGHIKPQFEGDDMPEHWNNGDGTISYAHETRHGRFRWWKCYSTPEAARNPPQTKD